MLPTPVYIGIDVACGKGKPLPICVVTAGNQLAPQDIPTELANLIPKGAGNSEIRSEAPFAVTARRVSAAIKHIAETLNWQIKRIAIDAPAIAPTRSPRCSECHLGRERLSSFRTPIVARWPDIRQRCLDHLDNGGTPSRLPFANMIWMSYGFELYKHLRTEFPVEVIETYPAAIVHEIEPGCEHKSTDAGYCRQLAAAARYTGWEPTLLEQRLKQTVRLTRHDRLDAFMAAWVASLPVDRRRAYGNADDLDDSIWVPHL